jgi:hypothetical protein
MKTNRKTEISKENLLKIDLAVQRESMVKQGFFDGRFKNKTYKSKKAYSRQKTKKSGFEEYKNPIFFIAMVEAYFLSSGCNIAA